MYAEVKLGKQTVPMLANAATSIRYKQVFKKNLFKYLNGSEPQENQTEAVQELAFIMAMSAQGADMMKLNQEEFLKWLERFEGIDLVTEDAINKIIDVFQGNQMTGSEAKKKKDQQSEK